jgi:hypothetical protein
MRLLKTVGLVLVVSLASCAPAINPTVVESGVAPASLARMNPGKILLLTVGAFSALLIFVLIVEGPD